MLTRYSDFTLSLYLFYLLSNTHVSTVPFEPFELPDSVLDMAPLAFSRSCLLSQPSFACTC